MGLVLMSGSSNFRYYDPKIPHRGETQFYNNYDNSQKPSFWKWQWNRLTTKSEPEPSYQPEFVKPDLGALLSNRRLNTITWIGHATVLLQVNGLNILIDPVFSERASPFSFWGPKRLAPLPLTVAQLPDIDIVLISHNHYDHMDIASLHALEEKGQGWTKFLVPLGNKAYLEGKDILQVQEFDWWDKVTFKEVEFTFTPSQHWSRRGIFDTNKTLWGGWHVQSKGRKFLYTGDTGYSPDFRDIYQRLGAVDLLMVPLGSYEPRWFMKQMHVNPDEAVQIHKDMHSRLTIGVHWGTFRLSDETMMKPVEDLNLALEKNNISSDEFRILKFGETLNFKSMPLIQHPRQASGEDADVGI
jgi:L-ascorbate metabolism protein UlaG (beta-lactamase superfamily)